MPAYRCSLRQGNQASLPLTLSNSRRDRTAPGFEVVPTSKARRWWSTCFRSKRTIPCPKLQKQPNELIARYHVKEAEDGSNQPSVRQPDQTSRSPRRTDSALVIGLSIGIFWPERICFHSARVQCRVFDFQPKFGAAGGGAKGAPDPKVVGKLFSRQICHLHQATGWECLSISPLAGPKWNGRRD